MRLCVVTFKECWRDRAGRWLSSGGFPMQMAAVGSLFDSSTLVVVEVSERPGGIPLPENARVVPLRRPNGRNGWRKLSVATQLTYYLSTIARSVSAADVVHTPLPGDIALLGLLVALLSRKRVLARYGGSWQPTPGTTFMNRVTRESMRRFAGGRNVMLATGAAPAGGRPPAPGIHWLFVTAISRREVAAVRPDLDRGPGRPLRVCYLGRLSQEKGVEDLIRALGVLRAQTAATSSLPSLTLVGDGPQRAELVELARREQCEGLIRFAGQLDRQAVISHLLDSDLCVLPSHTESFCKARLDAMLCGVPVITTEVGFGREIVGAYGERGWLVPAGKPADLANSLQQVSASPPDWPALRRRCREYVERFTLEAWAAEIGRICAGQWRLSLEEGKLRP